MKLQRTVFFLATFLSGTICSAAEEPFKKLTFVPTENNTWKAKTNGKEVLLVNEKKPAYPEMWTGDLQIRDLETGRLCTAVNVSLFDEVYAQKNGKIIIAITEVGGNYFKFIDIDTCEEKYPTVVGYSKRPHIKNNTITLPPGCEEYVKHVFRCSSAHIYALKQAGRPVLLERESTILTQKILGVGFLGTRYVYKPETPEAKFIAATASTSAPSVWLPIGEPRVHRVQVGGRELTVSHPADRFLGIYSSLTITDEKTGHACHTWTRYVREIYLLPEADVLIFQSSTHDKSIIGFLDVKTCKEKFPRIEFISIPIMEVLRDRIVTPPACEEADRDNKAVRQCAAARIYGFGPGHEPILLELESNTITRQVIGVEFSGYRQVENPYTQQAKLLPEEKQEGWFSSVKKWFSP